MTKPLLDKPKEAMRSARAWFLSKGIAGVIVAGVVAAVVLFVGVGGTMAATGVFPSLLGGPTASATPTRSPSPSPSGTAESAQAKNGELPADTPAEGHLGADGLAKLQQSGWVGARLSFHPGGYQLIYSGLSSGPGDNKITTRVSFNGGPGGGSQNCGPGRVGQTCPGSQSGPLIYSPYSLSFCLPGGDTYSVTVTGMGINFSESGIIPPGIISCPAPVAPVAPVAPNPPAPSVQAPQSSNPGQITPPDSTNSTPPVPPGDPRSVLPETVPTP